MKEQEKQMLSRALSLYLESIWNESDNCDSGSKRYEEILDESNLVKLFVRNNNIALPDNISTRF